MLFLSLGESVYALSLEEQGLEKHEIQQETIEREKNIGTAMPMVGELSSDGVLEVQRQEAVGENPYVTQNVMRRGPLRAGSGNGFRASVVEITGDSINRSAKNGTYSILFPKMDLQTSNTEHKTYTMTIADATIVNSVNNKSVSGSNPLITMNIVDTKTGDNVGTVTVENDGTNIIAKYTFNQTNDGVVYSTSPLTLSLDTKETNGESYTLLPEMNGSKGYIINFYGFNITNPAFSPDKKSATVTISKKPGYKLGTISVAGVPSNVVHTADGNNHTFSLSSGEYAHFGAQFSNEAQTEIKSIELGTRPIVNPTYAAWVSYDFKIEGNNLVATVTLTKDTKANAPDLPDTIDITSFSLTNGATKDIDQDKRLVINDTRFKATNEARSLYQLKDNTKITLTGEAGTEANTKVYKLEIPVNQWMKFKNDYKFLQASWNFKYNYDGEKNIKCN